jgi:cytochrome c-type biogenesis protein CcmH
MLNRGRLTVSLTAFAMRLAATGALAVAVDKPLADPALEARARALHKELRCLVCQNQSIEDSNADLARDLRTLVRERIAAGDSDDEAVAFIVDRYGDWVLLKPPLKAGTLLLWISPLLLLLAGATLAYFWFRRRGVATVGATPLSGDEQARLKELLGPENEP